MIYKYTPKGVCSKEMVIDIDNDTHIINDVKIIGGCAGNTLGISKLVKGRKAEEIIESLKGIPCGYRTTSCPDQLSIALTNVLKSID